MWRERQGGERQHFDDVGIWLREQSDNSSLQDETVRMLVGQIGLFIVVP